MDISLLPVTDHITPVPMTAQVTSFVISNAIAMFIAVAVVTGRFLCRIFLGAGLATDDWLILGSLILSATTSGLGFALYIAGADHPMEEVAMTGNLPHILLIVFVIVITSPLGLAMVKLSVLFFYMRIFDRKMRMYCWIVMGGVFVWFVATTMANIFICTPVRAQFDLAVAKPDSCGDQLPIFKSITIINLLTDIVIMIMPMKTIWSLNMRATEKIGLMMSFLLLFGVVIVGIVRYHYLSTVDLRTNITGTMPLSLFTTIIELNLGIVCVSIPMLRPLYTRYRAKFSASKLSDEAQRSDLQTYGGGKSKNRSGKTSRRRAGPAVDITLATFYDGAQKDEYGVGGVSEAAVEAGSSHSAGSGGESERNLTRGAAQSSKQAFDGRQAGGAIEVHKKWEIRRD